MYKKFNMSIKEKADVMCSLAAEACWRKVMAAARLPY